MQTTLVVDGYNAINAIPRAKKELSNSLEAARNAIIAISKEYARSSGYITDVRVVFDGDDRYRHLDGLNIPGVTFHIFSRTGQGDDKVIETVKKYAERGRVVLASNDNYIRNNARAYGAAIVDVRELEGRRAAGGRGQGAGSRAKDATKKISPSVEKDITRHYMAKLGLDRSANDKEVSECQSVRASKKKRKK